MMTWEKLATETAEATGRTFIVGVRAKGTWFAKCDGIEVDGDGPLHTTKSVVEELRQRAEFAAVAARQEADRQARIAGNLPNLRTR